MGYANGASGDWENFLNMISPIAGSVPYLTTFGNHETNYYDPNKYPGQTDDSRGERGVLSSTFLPQPFPSTLINPAWSYEIGLCHIVGRYR